MIIKFELNKLIINNKQLNFLSMFHDMLYAWGRI